MYKKTVKYTNFNGEEKTKDVYFHLSKPELMEMEIATSGSMSDRIKSALASKNDESLFMMFKEFLFKAYGVKSTDGEQFEKSEELSRKFEQSPVYDALYMELCTNTDAAIEFFTGIIPKDLADKVDTKGIKEKALQAVNN